MHDVLIWVVWGLAGILLSAVSGLRGGRKFQR